LRSDGCIDQAEGLRRLLVGNQTQVVTVVAGQGRMGRTSATINLAAALMRSGKDVLVLDENHAPDNLLDSLGLVAHYDLLDVAQGGCRSHDAVLESYGFGVLSAARAMHALAVSRASSGRSGGGASFSGPGLEWDEWQRMETALTEICSGVDVMLVDGAMLAGQAAAVSSSLASGASLLVVVEGTPSGITDSYALIKRLVLENARSQFGILVNKAVSEKAAMTVFENMAKVARRNLSVRLEYLGYVPFDDRVSCATQMCKPVLDAFPVSSSAKAYLELAQGLLRMPTRQDDAESGVATIIQSLMSQASQPLRGISKEIAHVVN
jgi:flagellar biosynthesis protein FlhG